MQRSNRTQISCGVGRHLICGRLDYLLKFVTRSGAHYRSIVEVLLEQRTVVINSPIVKDFYPIEKLFSSQSWMPRPFRRTVAEASEFPLRTRDSAIEAPLNERLRASLVAKMNSSSRLSGRTELGSRRLLLEG